MTAVSARESIAAIRSQVGELQVKSTDSQLKIREINHNQSNKNLQII